MKNEEWWIWNDNYTSKRRVKYILHSSFRTKRPFFIHKTKAPHFPLREGGAFVFRYGSELKNRIFRTYLNSSEKLFSVVFAWNSKLLAALLATSRKNAATILGLHTQAETMLVDALAIVGLECSFHCYLSICFSFFIAEIHSCSCSEQRFACFKDRQTISSKVHPFELS